MVDVGYALEDDLPDSRRGADRLALALYEVMADRSEADRRFVLRELQPPPPNANVGNLVRGHMVEALRLCEADIDRFPSYRAFEAWRMEQPDPREWPSGSSIARAYSSWSGMLDALGLEPLARPQVHTTASRWIEA